MKRYFHGGACERFLLRSWEIHNFGDMFGTVCAIYILATVYEGLKTLRNFLNSKQNRSSKRKTSVALHVVQSLLQIVQVVYGYVLMFAAMTLNVWLFVAVCLGGGTGYLIFGKTRWLQTRLSGLTAKSSSLNNN